MGPTFPPKGLGETGPTLPPGLGPDTEGSERPEVLGSAEVTPKAASIRLQGLSPGVSRACPSHPTPGALRARDPPRYFLPLVLCLVEFWALETRVSTTVICHPAHRCRVPQRPGGLVGEAVGEELAVQADSCGFAVSFRRNRLYSRHSEELDVVEHA